MGRHIQYPDLDLDEFRKRVGCTSRRSTTRDANIPPEQLRMHLCWGNYEGPHHCDVPLADIIDIVFTARPTRSRSRPPTRATPTNGRCSKTSNSPRARSSSPA